MISEARRPAAHDHRAGWQRQEPAGARARRARRAPIRGRRSFRRPRLRSGAVARRLRHRAVARAARRAAPARPEELIEQRLREGGVPPAASTTSSIWCHAASPLLARLAARRRPARGSLITSRAALGVSGEQEYPVYPLPRATRPRCSRPGLALSSRASRSMRRRRRSSPRSASASTACRSPSSWRPRVSGSCRRRRSSNRLDERLALLSAAPPTRRLASRRCGRRSTGATSCSSPSSSACSPGLSVFPGGARLEASRGGCGGDLDALDALVRQSLAVVSRRPGRRATLLDARDDPRVRRRAARGLGEGRGDSTHAQATIHAGARRAGGAPRARSAGVVRAARGRTRQHPGGSRLGVSSTTRRDRRPHRRGSVGVLVGRAVTSGRAESVWDESSPQTRRGEPRADGRDVRRRECLRATSADEQEGLRICREIVPSFEALGRPELARRGACSPSAAFEAAARRSRPWARNLIDRAIAIARRQGNDYRARTTHCRTSAGSRSYAGRAGGRRSDSSRGGQWTRGSVTGNVWGVALAENNLGLRPAWRSGTSTAPRTY